MLILGIDPGLVATGWGIVRSQGNALSFVACGTIRAPKTDALGVRLHHLSTELLRVTALHNPHEAAIEETFVNAGGQSTLKLGQARGALLLTLAQAGLPISEYAATTVKKSLTGAGRAEKSQVAAMVEMLLPGCLSRRSSEGAKGDAKHGADAMDALAIAITHAHHVDSRRKWG